MELTNEVSIQTFGREASFMRDKFKKILIGYGMTEESAIKASNVDDAYWYYFNVDSAICELSIIGYGSLKIWKHSFGDPKKEEEFLKFLKEYWR